MTLNSLKTVKSNFLNEGRLSSFQFLLVYRSICRNNLFYESLKAKKTNVSVYSILNESLSPKHLKSCRINPNIYKYRKFGESKVLVWDTRSKIRPKLAKNSLLLYDITNENTVKLMQIDRLLSAIDSYWNVFLRKHVPITLVDIP